MLAVLFYGKRSLIFSNNMPNLKINATCLSSNANNGQNNRFYVAYKLLTSTSTFFRSTCEIDLTC